MVVTRQTTTILEFFKPVRVPAAEPSIKTSDGGDDGAVVIAKPGAPRVAAAVSHSPDTNRHSPRRTSSAVPAIAQQATQPAAKRPRKQSAVEPELSEYERLRREKMAQNAMFLKQLGIVPPIVTTTKHTPQHANADGQAMPVKKRRQRMRAPPSHEPIRRSQRLRGAPAPSNLRASTDQTATTTDSVTAESDDEPAMTYDHSSVYRYACDATDPVVDSATQDPGSEESELVGFEFAHGRPPLSDPQLKKVYSIDFGSQRNGLIATGGHQGYVSIYGTSSTDSKERSNEAQAPLMSFKAHKGWISSVKLAQTSDAGRNVLLTSSNDGFVKVWDLNQTSTLDHSPKELFKTNEVHVSGIFGLDMLDRSIVSCSKDSSVAFSTLQDDASVQVKHKFYEHDGVVKSVRLSRVDPHQFVSGGNDRALRVFDVRVPSTAALEIRNAHARAINSVQWHPEQANWVLSAGFDPDVHLFDLRKPGLPLFTFHGHYLDNHQNVIYHPVFVRSGREIVAAGGTKCQDLSLYRTHDGATISRGFISMRADYIAVDPYHERLLVASGASLQFLSFRFK
ncbi:TPA: hypothetical protein N0F65_005389 [Lagenidium giganteum]|uniref:WD40 repeat-like protein n=1 Tax=Lagenidium giganteum TaxID=4803 RepID=A0AAV2YWQ2_9STRA|nr:TPA: hypothetical protein N0F65_005389 [Lagenidium giganteum]